MWPFFNTKIVVFKGEVHIISAFQCAKIEVKALDKGVVPKSLVTHRIWAQKQLQKNDKSGAYILQLSTSPVGEILSMQPHVLMMMMMMMIIIIIDLP